MLFLVGMELILALYGTPIVNKEKIFDKPFIARRNLGKNFNKCPLFRYRRFTPGHLGELAVSLSRSIQYEYWMQG